MSLQVRLKKGRLEAPRYGKWIYPSGDNWYTIDEQYRKYAVANDDIEIYEDLKIEIKKDSVEDNNKVNDENKGNEDQIIPDTLVQKILDMHWAQAKKKIKDEIDDIDFLKNKLLPALESANKDVLIKIVKEKIEELIV